MKRIVPLLFLVACGATPASELPAVANVPSSSVEIELRRGSASERATELQLRRLLARYDLEPWLFTRRLVVDETTTPHSHPVLTLHARHLRDDLLLLSTLIHEEGHWYVARHRPEVAAATAELAALAPDLPLGFPDGADTRQSTYEHLVVIAIEERGLQRLAGELAAREAMEFWATDHYRALYRYVIDHRAEVRKIMRNHGLGDLL